MLKLLTLVGTMKRIIFSILVMLVLLGGWFITQFDTFRAQSAFMNQEYERAFELFKAKAEEGDVLSQHNLGMMYYRGLGTGKDKGAARDWFEAAAAQDDDDSQYKLALMYDDKLSEIHNIERALKFYEAVALKGNARAQLRLGIVYTYGEGVDANYDLAFEWLTLAAKQDNEAEQSFAQGLLGYLYSSGFSVEKNYKLAADLYEKAAQKGIGVAQYGMAMVHGYGDENLDQNLVKAYSWILLAEKDEFDQAAKDARALKEILAKKMSVKQITEAEAQAKVLRAQWELN